jgi:hypothetical protein
MTARSGGRPGPSRSGRFGENRGRGGPGEIFLPCVPHRCKFSDFGTRAGGVRAALSRSRDQWNRWVNAAASPTIAATAPMVASVWVSISRNSLASASVMR